MLITAEQKDVVLNYLIKKESLRRLSDLKLSRSVTYLAINVELHDYYLHGGFAAQEELLEKNIKKLLLEIEALKPSMPDKINLLTGIIANISTALGLFLPR
jgi:DNA-binding TFAR19-related protein (PDSD5 family)